MRASVIIGYVCMVLGGEEGRGGEGRGGGYVTHPQNPRNVYASDGEPNHGRSLYDSCGLRMAERIVPALRVMCSMQ